MSIPSITQVGPKCNHLCPCKEGPREIRRTHREEGRQVEVEAEVGEGGIQPQVKKC